MKISNVKMLPISNTNSNLGLATLVLATLATFTASALPLTWRADWPDAKPVETLVHRGTDIELQPLWRINKEIADTNGWTFTTFCQTNAVGPWFGPLPGAFFSHTNDVGADFYNVMVRAQTPGGAVNYTAFARLRMLDSPGFTPGELPLPAKVLDFSTITVINPPWGAADLTSATNYTDAATNDLWAAIESVEPSPTNRAFSNAVLAVGLNLDTNTVAAINALVEAGDELPIGGAATVGTLLLALAAAVAALKRIKADKVANATVGNLAALDADGNLEDSGKDPGDFVQIGETNEQPYDEYMEGLVYPLFSVEAGYYSSESGEWIENAMMTFGADEIQTNSSTGSAIFSPGEVVVGNAATTETSTMTGSNVETPVVFAGALCGQNSYGIGDIELNESCFVHTPYDEYYGYAYQTSASAIIRAASDYEAGMLNSLYDVIFHNEYGTIGYTDSYTLDTTWATVQSVVSAANGWSNGYPWVDALTVGNYGTLSLQGGSIEFVDMDNLEGGYAYYLGISDAIRIGSLNTGYWVYDGYDPYTGETVEKQLDASTLEEIVGTYYGNGFVLTGTNQVPETWGYLFSVLDESGTYETVFTGRTVEIGANGASYTIVSDSGVTAMSLELYDGNTLVTLSPSELQQLKALIQSNP